MKKIISLISVMVLSMSLACGWFSGGEDEEAPEAVEAEAQAVATPTTETATATPAPTPTVAQLVTSLDSSSPLSPPIVANSVSPIDTPVSIDNSNDKVDPLPGTEALVAEAKRQLAQTTGARLASGEVSLRSIESQEWPDTSLGCPQEGVAYATVITPGYLLILEAGGQAYEFHTDTGDQVVPCFEE